MVEASRATTPTALQHFYNSDLGETFVPPGGRISIDVLDRCRRDYLMPDASQEPAWMGVDVGLKLHVVVRQTLQEGMSRALFIGEVDSFEELDRLMQCY